jgi:hypothetical protein
VRIDSAFEIYPPINGADEHLADPHCVRPHTNNPQMSKIGFFGS